MLSSEELVAFLDELSAQGAGARLLTLEDWVVDLEEISARQRYDIVLAGYNAIVRQTQQPSQELLHSLVNLYFPVQSPWSPVFLPPPGPGTYLLAHPWAPHTPASALWRPARGFVWGRWYPPTGKHVALPLMPGDRWRAL